MKILLLEDELMLNSAISEYLKNIGHMVESFFDGAEVLKSIENGYDLLILDVNVPNVDGFSILNELNNRKIHIPTIFISAQNNTTHIRFSENYSYSKDKQTLYFNGEPQNLTKKQLEIIHILALNINMIVDFERFRVDVWDAENIDNPTIRAEISRLKKSLKEDFIKNIRGLGYKIDRYYSV